MSEPLRVTVFETRPRNLDLDEGMAVCRNCGTWLELKGGNVLPSSFVAEHAGHEIVMRLPSLTEPVSKPVADSKGKQ